MTAFRKAGAGAAVRKYSMYFALVAIMAIFTVLTGGTFLSARNLTNLMLQTSYIAIIAIGVVFIIIAGHTDLSIGSLTGLIGGVMAILQVKFGWSTPAVILAGIAVGVALGAFQGFWIAYKAVPAFIVTLAGMLTFRGILIMLTKGETIAPMHGSFRAIGQGYLPRLDPSLPFNDTAAIATLAALAAFVGLSFRARAARKRNGVELQKAGAFAAKLVFVSAAIVAIGSVCAFYRGIPYSALILAIFAAVLSFVSTRTPFGRYVFAIGGNSDAARLSGINIGKINFFLYVVMGGLAAISGLLFTARLNSATASAGTFFEFDAITAAVIGGASILGGEGSVIGAVVGAVVMGSLNNGMGLLNIPTDRQQMIKGLILLLVVWFDISMRKRQK